MKKLFALIPVVLVLAACEPTLEQRTKLELVLPDNCKVYEVGAFGEIKSLIIVRCKGIDVTTANGVWTSQSGKTTVTDQFSSVVLDE